MTEVRRLYLDTNVLILLGEGRGEQAGLMSDLAAQQERPDFLCTSELTLAELLVHPFRANDGPLIDRYDHWLISGSFMEVGTVDRSVLWNAAILRASYPSLKLPDAIHLSTAIGFGCSHFLSADARLPATIELTNSRSDPNGASLAISVVQPTIEALQDIMTNRQAP